MSLSLVGCQAKAAVVCAKLEGCGLLAGTATECEQVVREAFADDGVDGEKLTLCIDCFATHFCSEISGGRCEEDCAEVLEQIREAGIIGEPEQQPDAGS